MKTNAALAAGLAMALLMLGAGVAIYISRAQQGPPPEYQDATIHGNEVASRQMIRVPVVKGDQETMRKRIAAFIRRNGGSVHGQGHDRIHSTVPENIVPTLRELDSPWRRIAPGYREWPERSTTPRQNGEMRTVQIEVRIRGVTWRKGALDAAVAAMTTGGLATIGLGTTLACRGASAHRQKGSTNQNLP